jgi:hypothetical protein
MPAKKVTTKNAPQPKSEETVDDSDLSDTESDSSSGSEAGQSAADGPGSNFRAVNKDVNGAAHDSTSSSEESDDEDDEAEAPNGNNRCALTVIQLGFSDILNRSKQDRITPPPPFGFSETKNYGSINKVFTEGLEQKQIWIITAPADIDLSQLEGLEIPIHPDGETKFQAGSQDYRFISSKLESEETVLVPRSTAMYALGKGVVRSVRLLPQYDAIQPRLVPIAPSIVTTKTVRQQPPDLKMRYTPSGVPKTSEQRLREEDLQRERSRPKAPLPGDEEMEMDLDFYSSPQVSPTKKRKRKEDPSANQEVRFDLEQVVPESPKKKSKQDKNSAILHESTNNHRNKSISAVLEQGIQLPDTPQSSLTATSKRKPKKSKTPKSDYEAITKVADNIPPSTSKSYIPPPSPPTPSQGESLRSTENGIETTLRLKQAIREESLTIETPNSRVKTIPEKSKYGSRGNILSNPPLPAPAFSKTSLSKRDTELSKKRETTRPHVPAIETEREREKREKAERKEQRRLKREKKEQKERLKAEKGQVKTLSMT